MIDVHAAANTAIQVVNSDVPVTLKVSTGYTVDASFNQVPQYEEIDNVLVNVQALTYTDLMKLNGMNMTGIRRAVYAYGFYAGIIRDKARGGDLIVFPTGLLPEGDTWLIAYNLETWPSWVKLAVTLQNGS